MYKLQLIGNAGKEPEVKQDRNGNEFVVFSIAVNTGTKQLPKADWVDVTCNGRQAEIAKQFIIKGTKVYLEGYPSVNAYINRQNAITSTMKLTAHNIEILANFKQNNNEAAQQHDNIPF